MRAREYDRRIQVFERTLVSDGRAGMVPGPAVLIASSWAKLVNKNVASKIEQYGLTDAHDVLIFWVRHRQDVNYNLRNIFLQYRGQNYIIKGIRNVDMRNTDLEIVCVMEAEKSIPNNTPITPED